MTQEEEEIMRKMKSAKGRRRVGGRKLGSVGEDQTKDARGGEGGGREGGRDGEGRGGSEGG